MHAALPPGPALQFREYMKMYVQLSAADVPLRVGPQDSRVHFIHGFDASYAVHYHDHASGLSYLTEEDGICSLVAVADSGVGVGYACDGPNCPTTFRPGDLFLTFPVPVVAPTRRSNEVRFKLSSGNGPDLHLGGFPRAGTGPGVPDPNSQLTRCGSSRASQVARHLCRSWQFCLCVSDPQVDTEFTCQPLVSVSQAVVQRGLSPPRGWRPAVNNLLLMPLLHSALCCTWIAGGAS